MYHFLDFIRQFWHESRLNQVIMILGSLIVLGLGGSFLWWQTSEIIITNSDRGRVAQAVSDETLSGLPCTKAFSRPVAVMLSSDAEARPLSGIGQADIVFEMPVVADGFTRMMAVFECNAPTEIGSIRSAREDFVPLAQSFGAVYAHWGGEHGVLEKLDRHVIDNVNALIYENTYFTRKKGIPMPHNGFTTPELLTKAIRDLNYRTDESGHRYERTAVINNSQAAPVVVRIEVPFVSATKVAWDYDQASKTYARSRNGQPEIDRNTNQIVQANVVIVMETNARILSQDYITVAVSGQGKARIYQGGTEVSGSWRKDINDPASPLILLDDKGKEAELLPGPTWIEITATPM